MTGLWLGLPLLSLPTVCIFLNNQPTDAFIATPKWGTLTVPTNIQNTDNSPFTHHHALSRSSSLSLIPLSTFEAQINFLSTPESYRLCIGKNGQLRPSLGAQTPNNSNDKTGKPLAEPPYLVCLAEEDDLPSLSRLTIDAFGTDVVTLSGELNEFERALIGPTVGVWNAYTDIFAFTEVLSGLRTRMSHRLGNGPGDGGNVSVAPPPVTGVSSADAAEIAKRSSLILAVARRGDGDDVDCVATVELRLQPTDAKIPFSQPWLDAVERKMANLLGVDTSPRDSVLQPYLSNLCVAENVRGRMIGRALVRCVDRIAANAWGYDQLYLHVDLKNTPAIKLYKSEGFEDVGIRWNPFWAGTSAEIGYFVKKLERK